MRSWAIIPSVDLCTPNLAKIGRITRTSHTALASQTKGRSLRVPFLSVLQGPSEAGECGRKGIPPPYDTPFVPGGSSLEHSPAPEEEKWSQASPLPLYQPPGPFWGRLDTYTPWEAQKPIGNGWTTGGVKESSKMAQEVGSQSLVWFFPIHQLVAHATLPLSPPQGHITCLLSGSHLKNRSPERERICQSIHSKSGTKWLGN